MQHRSSSRILLLLVALLVCAVVPVAGNASERQEQDLLPPSPLPGPWDAAAVSADALDTCDSPEEWAAESLSRRPPTGDCYELRPAVSHGQSKGRRCEPQCIPYVRCRSGIMSCRTGMENGPLTWFACEARLGNTTTTPLPGSVLILSANARRKMPTGHGLYVEEAVELSPALFRLVLSHTNFDRRCSLETNIEARYDRERMTVDFLAGAWRDWGHGLQAAGFILNNEVGGATP